MSRKLSVRIRLKWFILSALKLWEPATFKPLIKLNPKRESRKSLNLSLKFKASSSIREKIHEFRLSSPKQWQTSRPQSMELSPKRQKAFSKSLRTTSRASRTNLLSLSKALRTKERKSLLSSGKKSGRGMNSLKIWSTAKTKSLRNYRTSNLLRVITTVMQPTIIKQVDR